MHDYSIVYVYPKGKLLIIFQFPQIHCLQSAKDQPVMAFELYLSQKISTVVSNADKKQKAVVGMKKL